MPHSPPSWVRKNACPVDLSGGQCIGDDETLTHHTKQRGQYINAPRPEIPDEVEVSVMPGKLTKAQACAQRNRGVPAHPADVERAGIRYARTGDLRGKGFAVIHTCGRKGEAYGHVSWYGRTPIRLISRIPPGLHLFRETFASCFTEQEG